MQIEDEPEVDGRRMLSPYGLSGYRRSTAVAGKQPNASPASGVEQP